jgi:hypothetical protein
MKYHKYIFVSFFLISSISFSQPTFTNLDSLLSKNFQAVNLKDSTYYLSILNTSAIFKDKKVITKSDSLMILKPYTDSFRDLINELSDMTASTDFTVTYLDFENVNKRMNIFNVSGKIPLNVNMIINNQFTLKMPFSVYAFDGKFSIQYPMTVMFADGKE